MDYKNGKIYRLVCNQTNRQYIGSTTQSLTKRKHGHKKAYTQWKKGNTSKKLSSACIIDGGDYEIILIELYPCQSNEELRMRERYWQEQMECVNIQKAYQSQEEKNLYDNEYKKIYYQSHKTEIQEYHKNYREEHKEEKQEYNRNYYENHREEILEQQREYWDQHKEEKNKKRREKVECDCGLEIRKDGLETHIKTQKHINLMNKK